MEKTIRMELSLPEMIIIQYAISYAIKTTFETFNSIRFSYAEMFKRISPIIEENFRVEENKYQNNSMYSAKFINICWEAETKNLYEVINPDLNKYRSTIDFYFTELNFLNSALNTYSKGNYFERIAGIDKRTIKTKIIKANANRIEFCDKLMKRILEIGDISKGVNIEM